MLRIAAIALLLCVSTTAAAKSLTLEQAVSTAEKSSPLVSAAKHGLNALEQQYKEAWWSWFPKLTLKSISTLIPPQDIDEPKEDDPDLSGFNLWSKTDIEAYVPIYTFGKISALKAMAKSGTDIGHAAVKLAKQEVRYQTTRAWYSIQLAAELQALIDEGEKELKKARDKLEEMEAEDSEDFDQNDMFRLRIYEAKVAKRVMANRRLSRLALSGLKVAMGLKSSAQLELPKDNPLLPVRFAKATLDQLITKAVGNRPELQILKHKISVQSANVERRWADFFPDFFAAGSFTYAASTVNQFNTVFSSTVFNALGGGAAVGLKLTLDYPAKLARYRKANAELSQAKSKLTAQKGLLRLELEKGLLEANDSHAMVQLNRRAMKAAKALLTAEVLEYENDLDGNKPFKDVLDASATFLLTKTEWLHSVYTFNTAVAQLCRIVGTDVTRIAPTKGAPK